jgi:hypothetical protein
VPTITNAFVKNDTNRNESALGPGLQLGDGTFTLNASRNSGGIMLSGGPANISPTTSMVESFPSVTSSWPARVDRMTDCCSSSSDRTVRLGPCSSARSLRIGLDAHWCSCQHAQKQAHLLRCSAIRANPS